MLITISLEPISQGIKTDKFFPRSKIFPYYNQIPKQTGNLSLNVLPHFRGFTYSFHSKTYLCIIAVQHFLNNPNGKFKKGNFPVPVPFKTVVCGVIIA